MMRLFDEDLSRADRRKLATMKRPGLIRLKMHQETHNHETSRQETVSSCSWKLALTRLPGEDLSHVHDRKDSPEMATRVMKRATQYNVTQRQFLLNTYYKFMFVREPLERLVSAYRNKCLRDPYYRRWLPRRIRQHQRPNKAKRTGKYDIRRFITDRHSTGGNAIASVRPSVCPSVSL